MLSRMRSPWVFVPLSALLSLYLLVGGCEGLRQLDTSAAAEGTGVQIFGAVVVLARYRANEQQKRSAIETAESAYVREVLGPAYKSRAEEISRQRDVQLAQVRRQRPPAPPTPGLAQQVADDKEAEARVEATVEEKLSSLNSAWKAETSRLVTGGVVAPPTVPVGTRDASALFAGARAGAGDPGLLVVARQQAPRFLAVAVPGAGNPAEAQGAATVMIWDSESKTLRDENVLVLNRRPQERKPTKVDDLPALFVARREDI